MRILFYIVFSVFGFLFSNAITVINPKFDRLDVPAFHISKVEVTKDTTFVHCIYSARSNSWASISHNTFLRDTETGKEFPIYRSSGIPFGPQKRTFAYDERCELLFCFPSIKSSKRIDFIENENEKAFNVYGIDMEQEYDTIYRESDLTRFSNMASFYDAAGDTIKAIQFKEKVKDVTEYIYGIKSEPLLLCMLGLSIMYDKYSLHKEGIDLMEKLTVLHTEIRGKADWNYALQLRNLAIFYSNAQKYDLAIKKDKEAIALFESLGIIDNEYALALGFISHDYYYIGDFSNSFLYQERAIRARKHIKDVDAYINELYNTLLYTNGGKEDIIKRIGLVDKGLLDCTDLIDSTSLAFAKLYRQMAFSYSLIDENNNAIKYCDKALAIMDGNRYNDNEDYAELLGLKCKYQQRNGLIDEAISSGAAAKQLYESLNIRSLKYAKLLSDLAEYHRKNGSYQKTIEYQTEVADLYSKLYGEDIDHYAASLLSLSRTYSEIADFSEAVSTAEKAINIYRDSNIRDEKFIFILNYIAAIYGVLNYKRAIEMDEEALSIASNIWGKDNIQYAKVLSDYAFLYTFVDNKKAIEYAKEALCIYDKGKDKDDTLYGFLLDNISFCYSSIGDYVSAIKYSFERLKLLDECDISYSRCNESIAENYANMKDYSKASEYIYNSLNSVKKMIDHSSNTQDIYRQYLYWVATGYYDKLVGYVTKNITPVTVSMLYDETLNTKTIRLRKGNEDWYSWKGVQSRLKNNEIAIEFIHKASVEDSTIYIYALLVKKNQDYPKMIKVYDNNEFMRCMEMANSNFERDYYLGKIIWGRLEDELRGVNNIYFTPTWTFTSMPIEHFPVSETQYYNDIYNIYRLTSTMQLIKRDEYDNSYSNAVLYGGLTYEKESDSQTSNTRNGYEPLFNTQIEINEISDVLNNVGVKATKFTGVNGTERSIRNLSGGNTDILHIATHGINIESSYGELSEGEIPYMTQQYDPTDDVHSNSFLVLSGANPLSGNVVPNGEDDGLLTSKDVSQLNLHNIKLLVLSACESGRGNYGTDDMLWGIHRGFKEAGVKSILMSLKKVDDEATRILMVDFYKNLMKGKTKLQSLKDAQKHLRQIENGKYNDPIYWASFIMLDGLN